MTYVIMGYAWGLEVVGFEYFLFIAIQATNRSIQMRGEKWVFFFNVL